jgi:transposase-like protein
MHCIKCGCVEKTKSGKAHGMQRYRCKGCGYQFTKSSRRGYPIEVRKRAVALYLEGIGFRAISRLLSVSHVSLQRWVKDLAHQIQIIKSQEEQGHSATLMELDEMWHYVGKKRTNSGCGWLLIETSARSWPSGSVLVVEKR